jgi:hypothetical protein
MQAGGQATNVSPREGALYEATDDMGPVSMHVRRARHEAIAPCCSGNKERA